MMKTILLAAVSIVLSACVAPSDPGLEDIYVLRSIREPRPPTADGCAFPVRCQLVLSGLPAPFVGGLLTTNTMTTQAAFGGATEPPGYTQASPRSACGGRGPAADACAPGSQRPFWRDA